MAEKYIKLSDAKKAIEDYRSELTVSKYGSLEACMDAKFAVTGVMKELDYITAADVVPKSEYDAVVSAVDNSTKEFLKLHDDYQKQKKELDKYKSIATHQTNISMDRYFENKRLKEDIYRLEKINESDVENIRLAKVEVARGIFEELKQKRTELWNTGKYTMFECWSKAEEELKKKYIPQNDDRCVVCGEIVPEGRQVCPKCQIEKGD